MSENAMAEALKLARTTVEEYRNGGNLFADWPWRADVLARNLITRLEPVNPIRVSNTWKCECGSIEVLVHHKFCSNCGRPLNWK